MAWQHPIPICALAPQGAGPQSIWQWQNCSFPLFQPLKNTNSYSPHRITVWEIYQSALFWEKEPSRGKTSPLGIHKFPVQEVWDAGLNLQQHFSQQSTGRRAVHLHRCFFGSIWDVQSPFTEHQQCSGVCLMSFLYSFLNVNATKLFRKVVYIYAWKENIVPIFSFPCSFPLQVNAKL